MQVALDAFQRYEERFSSIELENREGKDDLNHLAS